MRSPSTLIVQEMVMTNPRAVYAPIFDRPPLKLPGDARIVVWPVINVEEWDIA